MDNIERGVTSMREVQTAADLRRQLHTMKWKDREAVAVAAQASPVERFYKSNYFTALLTGASMFGLLFLTNPSFVQEDKAKYAMPTPNLKRVAAWAILALLIVALGPLVYEKFLTPK